MKYVTPMYNNEAVATEDIICVSDVVVVKNTISESNPITFVNSNGEKETLTSGLIGNASTLFSKLS
ncbi:MAG: hypothetical protein J6B34_03710 [Clostridia bacterium]|nr:hypothetical protein [Clostridia bacterium]